ncbi:MAG: hypothetical protein MI975_21265 [Cytophagales bacterium]|nr:hypothetical protein [Cytophagales bacterium]
MDNSYCSFAAFSNQTRRNFLKNLSLGTGGVLLSPSFSSCSAEYKSDLYKNFLEPSAEAKPFFRWWWNGNRLSKKELSRELRLMRGAGIGGVEINPIQMPEQAEVMVDEECRWLSDEWIDFLQFAIREANGLGMVTDLIVGTGWPFGGEFLNPEETAQGFKVEVIPLSGPGNKIISLPSEKEGSHVMSLTLFPVKLSGLNEGIVIPFKKEDTRAEIHIPSGNYELRMLILRKNFGEVMHGAPGGAGPVLDHFNKRAVEKYLNHMSDRIKERTGKDTLEGIRALFCDSIELNSANWTTGFAAIFKTRRGYDIMPYLPLLLKKYPDIDNEFEDELKRARYDYSLTLAELFKESFVVPFHNWCNANGVLSRYQAYGHPWLYTDLIEGYSVPNIPEGDQWLFNGAWQPYADVDQIRYAIWNKYASSAGHLGRRKIISTEAMTNTSGVFRASLKYIKQATDLNLATGVNHQVLHGYNYSPPQAGFPGWVRYGCYFNEKNPWWRYMPAWSRYSSRLSQVFQDASPVSQVAILGPTPDIWSQYGLDRNPFNLNPWYLHALWQALNHLGFCIDYVNGNLLKTARLEGGSIVIGSMKYEVLLFCDVETMESDLARKIEDLTHQGARIVMIGKKPGRSPNMIGAPKNDGIVKKSIENALSAGIQVAAAPEDQLQAAPELLMKWADQLMKNSEVYPHVEFSHPGSQLFQIQYRKEDVELLFLCNVDRARKYESELSTGSNINLATKWDPETGKRLRLKINKNGRIDISLQPLESVLIVLDPLDNPKFRSVREMVKTHQRFEMSSPWKITFRSVEGREGSLRLASLKPLNKVDGYENFAGEIIYNTEFHLEKRDFESLTIDEVYETAEVKLNGRDIGLSWWGNNVFDVKGKLRKGKNRLEIKVTTLLANYVASLKENKTAQFWTSKYKDKTPVKCGLAGKVTLK